MASGYESPGMSEAALKNCRSMKIVTDENGKSTFEVFDPRLKGRRVAENYSRNPQDYTRILRSYMARYRIPKENVEIIDLRPEATNADRADSRTSEIHESGKELLGGEGKKSNKKSVKLPKVLPRKNT